MTSEIETLKTNEFLRRRKLRLQQVREQSKDIAKKVRQRATVEKIRRIVDIDAQKEKEYLQYQGKLVNKLQELYAKGITSIGTAHKHAEELKNQDKVIKNDVAKLRGKEAAAELKKRKQEKLDEQKRILDRKLKARVTANEISREKSNVNKLLSKPESSTDRQIDLTNVPATITAENENEKSETVTKHDMATQWDLEGLRSEWIPNVPELSLPLEDSVKESTNDKLPMDTKSAKSKRPNLFAVSDEMPSSLRGGLIDFPEDNIPVKPSFTLVSEYIQNRVLHLRESETSSSRNRSEDLQSLKQTILKSRASKTRGSSFNNICHVIDGQMYPVPTWQAEIGCGFCPSEISQEYYPINSRQFKVTNSQINKIFSSIRPFHQERPNPIIRGSSPFRRNKLNRENYNMLSVSANESNAVQSTKSSLPESALLKKNSVTMYNHATKDLRDVRYKDAGLVVRDQQSDENAYSQALKETATSNDKDKEYQQKIQDMRNKVAMTKKSVEKEYKDTMAFLNSLPRDNKPVKNAYKDERAEKAQREIQQRTLQQEFNKIEKECRKHRCANNKHTETTHRSQSKSPAKASRCNDLGDRDFEYSWMPVPESDGNLIVHTIPTTLKEGKSGNTVKFSEIDSYHEYRSRHKHTPPTRDRGNFEKKKVVETVLSEQNPNETTGSSSIASDSSSVENLVTRTSKKSKVSNNDLSDAEKIIIYKILDSKSKKRKAKKMINNTAKSLNSIVNEKPVEKVDTDRINLAGTGKVLSHDENMRNLRSVEQLNEGVYKTVSERGTNLEMWQTSAERKPWWDNITTMYFSGNKHGGEKIILTDDEIRHGRPCCCGKTLSKDEQREKCCNVSWEIEGNQSTERTSKSCVGCKCGCASKHAENRSPTSKLTSAATSTSSFKTAKATVDKTNTAQPDEGFIKLIDDGVQEAGKFYIGASGFLKDDDYEVVIQLRKKDASKDGEKDIIEEKSSVSQITKSVDEAFQPGKVIADLKEKNDCSQQISKAHVSPEALDNKESDIFIQNQADRDNQDIETQMQPDKNDDNLCEKETFSSLPVSDAIKIKFPKNDQITKAVSSAYTQTTGSPSHGQVFIHMSSSTSTAYMSPPELILPKFLKHGYHYNQLYEDPKQTPNYQDERYNVKEQKEDYKENKECMCRRCIAKNVVLSRLTTSVTSGRSKKSRTLETPPSTAKSYTSPYSQRYAKKCASGTAHSSPLPKKHQCRCRKSTHKLCSKECVKSHRCRRTVCSSKKSSKNVDGVNSKAPSYKNKLNYRCDKKLSTTSLDPIIKDYVNKVLSLNREGLKTIEIVNQECSAVTTPGSSIINVPYNLNSNKPVMDHKISLEQVKWLLMQQISEEYLRRKSTKAKGSETLSTETNTELNFKNLPRVPRWKQVHKVKSLNISKRMLKKRDKDKSQPRLHTLMSSRPMSSSSSTREIVKRRPAPSNRTDVKTSERKDIKSSLSPKDSQHDIFRSKDILMEKIDSDNRSQSKGIIKCPAAVDNKAETSKVSKVARTHSHKINDVLTDRSFGSETNCNLLVDDKNPVHTSTQTNGSLDSEINFMKLAEDKLQNMEKIADLTEKCTKRLSSLAKVLEGVRKNKSLAYSQMSASDSTSDSEPKSDKNIPTIKAPTFALNHMVENDKSPESKALLSTNNETSKNEKILQPMEFVPFLTDIPKPVVSSSPLSLISTDEHSLSKSIEHITIKTRPKPPPALTRVNLKNGQDCIVPHELSTVLEVDSPMSLKNKTKSSQNGNKTVISDDSNKFSNSTEDLKSNSGKVTSAEVIKQIPNLDLLQSDIHLLRQSEKSLSADSSDDSKLRMIDLKQFNEIMLKPYITLQEYAKQRNVGGLEEGSNQEEIPKDGVITDDISSLRSDGSLPDVIAELLKRNIINEPFKFDTPSNVNSTTVSSDSTFPMIALSKARRDKKKQSVVFQNKEKVVETSDSLSISSNPDLENAFKKLGLGWASSTLKKTKERLALSSSSNTSSSSLSHLKLKSFDKQNIPNLVSESVSSVKNAPETPLQEKNISNNSKNVEQQTLLTNSMTVKEFLTNELAKKITFTNKSNRSDTVDEFVSLYETKIPDEMKRTSGVGRGDRSGDSVNNNRARTSTPVQIYKAAAYHSSSSSNLSNGLFSNIEDLSSVKGTSNSLRNYSTTDKDDLTIPNYSLKTKKGLSDCSKSD